VTGVTLVAVTFYGSHLNAMSMRTDTLRISWHLDTRLKLTPLEPRERHALLDLAQRAKRGTYVHFPMWLLLSIWTGVYL